MFSKEKSDGFNIHLTLARYISLPSVIYNKYVHKILKRMEDNFMKKKLSKKVIASIAMMTMCVAMMTGCGENDGDKEICVISREDGSGTRDAFTELLGIMEDDVDNTTINAEITNSTSVMMTTVAGNTEAIGYVSLGSLNDSVKVIKVDGVEATTDNVSSGEYAVARPFNIVTGSELSENAQDFINFIMSKEGQRIISEEGYIPVGGDSSYTASGLTGKVTLAGSTSVAPVMEKIAEKYMELNEGMTIEIQQSGSGAGITSTIEGVCDIGMSSRDLKDNEITEGVSATKIAMDGIAVIVNLDNAVEDLTSEQIKSIFVGETTQWSEVQ